MLFRSNAALIDAVSSPLIQKTKLGEITQLPHSVMISTTTASLELAILKDPRFRFRAWPEVYETMPDEQKMRENFFSLPVDITHQFRYFDKNQGAMVERTERKQFDMVPDGICEIEHTNGDAIGLTIEAENRKDTRANNLNHTSFLKTVLAYRHVTANRLYDDWGLTSLMVLFVTRSERKINEMKKVVMEVTRGRGSSQFCFRTIPILGNPEKAPKPDDTLFTGAWDRAGHPPIALCDLFGD